MNESGCVFCRIVEGTAPATIVQRWADGLAIVPLTPVVEGHTLVIPTSHVRDAASDHGITATVMNYAAAFASQFDSFNIITSAGRAATQSIEHLHIHVVPRSEDDQLMVPWGTIYGDDPTAPHWCRQAQALQDQLSARSPNELP